jgi:hypothetical protein
MLDKIFLDTFHRNELRACATIGIIGLLIDFRIMPNYTLQLKNDVSAQFSIGSFTLGNALCVALSPASITESHPAKARTRSIQKRTFNIILVVL